MASPNGGGSTTDPGVSRMDDSRLEHSGPLHAAIGEAFLREAGEDVDLFLYIEAGDGWLDIAPFKVRGDSMEWFLPDPDISEVITRAWEAEDPDKRWAAMEYEVVDGQFTARMKFPDELDPDEFASDRRKEILRRRFGNKTIRYPKLF